MSTWPAGMKARMLLTCSSRPPLFMPVTVPSTIWPTSRFSQVTLVDDGALAGEDQQAFARVVAIDVEFHLIADLGLGLELLDQGTMPWLLPPKSTKTSSLLTGMMRPLRMPLASWRLSGLPPALAVRRKGPRWTCRRGRR